MKLEHCLTNKLPTLPLNYGSFKDSETISISGTFSILLSKRDNLQKKKLSNSLDLSSKVDSTSGKSYLKAEKPNQQKISSDVISHQ